MHLLTKSVLYLMNYIKSLKPIKSLVLLILFLLLILCLFNACKLCRNEHFNINLEKKFALYQDYRNFIDNNDYLLLKHNPVKRNFPYKISTNCFADKFQRCQYIGTQSQITNRKIVDKLCEDISLDQCVIP